MHAITFTPLTLLRCICAITAVALAVILPGQALAAAPPLNSGQSVNRCLSAVDNCPVSTSVPRSDFFSQLISGYGERYVSNIAGGGVQQYTDVRVEKDPDPGTVKERANFHHRYCGLDYWVSIVATFRLGDLHQTTELTDVTVEIWNNSTTRAYITQESLFGYNERQFLDYNVWDGNGAGPSTRGAGGANLSKVSKSFAPSFPNESRAFVITSDTAINLMARDDSCVSFIARDEAIFYSPRPNPAQKTAILQLRDGISWFSALRSGMTTEVNKNIKTINANNKKMDSLALAALAVVDRKNAVTWWHNQWANASNISSDISGHRTWFSTPSQSSLCLGMASGGSACATLGRPSYVNSSASADRWHTWAFAAWYHGVRLPAGAADCWNRIGGDIGNAWTWYSNIRSVQWDAPNWYMWTLTTLTQQCFDAEKLIAYAYAVDAKRYLDAYNDAKKLHDQSVAATGQIAELKSINATLWSRNLQLQTEIANATTVVNIFITELNKARAALRYDS